MKRGKFIVLEGGEGAGKSTIAEFLMRELLGHDIAFTREPGGTPLAERIREVIIAPDAQYASPETELALIFAARFDLVQELIRPARASGKDVICERFISASYAYQLCGNEASYLKPLFREYTTLLGDCVPDHYLLLDVEPIEGLKRAKGSGKKIDHFEARELAFHERVRTGLTEFMKTVPSTVVDANRPLEAVQKEVLALIKTLLNNQ